MYDADSPCLKGGNEITKGVKRGLFACSESLDSSISKRSNQIHHTSQDSGEKTQEEDAEEDAEEEDSAQVTSK